VNLISKIIFISLILLLSINFWANFCIFIIWMFIRKEIQFKIEKKWKQAEYDQKLLEKMK